MGEDLQGGGCLSGSGQWDGWALGGTVAQRGRVSCGRWAGGGSQQGPGRGTVGKVVLRDAVLLGWAGVGLRVFGFAS